MQTTIVSLFLFVFSGLTITTIAAQDIAYHTDMKTYSDTLQEYRKVFEKIAKGEWVSYSFYNQKAARACLREQIEPLTKITSDQFYRDGKEPKTVEEREIKYCYSNWGLNRYSAFTIGNVTYEFLQMRFNGSQISAKPSRFLERNPKSSYAYYYTAAAKIYLDSLVKIILDTTSSEKLVREMFQEYYMIMLNNMSIDSHRPFYVLKKTNSGATHLREFEIDTPDESYHGYSFVVGNRYFEVTDWFHGDPRVEQPLKEYGIINEFYVPRLIIEQYDPALHDMRHK